MGRRGNYRSVPAPSVPSEALLVPDDSELWGQIRRGDEAAFRDLVDRQGRYLYGVAHALTGNPTDAEDLVQETFVGAIRSRFRGQASLRTWLVRILVNRAGMLRRSKRRHRQVAIDPPVMGSRHELAVRPSTSATEARLDLTTMLAGLSPEHRAVIVLRELEGLSYEQMAAVLQVPRGTVESRLHRAREELRKRYREYF